MRLNLHISFPTRLMVLVGDHGEYLGEATVFKRGSRYPELTAGLIEEFLRIP